MTPAHAAISRNRSAFGHFSGGWLLYRLLSGLFVLINAVVLAVVLVGAAIPNPKEALAGGVTLLLGLPVYFYYKRKQKE